MYRFFSIILFCTFIIFQAAVCRAEKYDLLYIWDENLTNVLDYQSEIEVLLSPEDRRKLRIVGRSTGGYGLLYDLDGDALESARMMVSHSEMLRKAGLSECTAIKDEGYYRLYNVSYGLGPNLEALKVRYQKIYEFLGDQVGKNLYIEKTDADNYTLIYRRRGDRRTTYKVARRHAKLLKKKRITTTIIPESNNPVIFGESSHLDGADTSVQVVSSPKKPVKASPEQTKKASVKPPAPSPGYLAASSGVEQSIEAFIGSLRKKGKLSSDETTGWVVYDFTTGKNIVDINADQVFQAASMIKPFVALAFFHQATQGKIIYGPKSRRRMERMIQHSDNPSTNWVMRIVGGPAACDKLLRTHYPHIFKKTKIVEYIPAGGKTYRNSAVPSDYIRFLDALWNNQLPYGKELRRLMSLPGRDRLYDGTPIPQGTLVYNKTGSTAHLCGDMGILVPRDKNGRRYPYALVGIIERSSRPKNYGNWMLTRGNVIREVSTIVYQQMKRQYQLL
ncbi:MAG: serine hydrolase [Desulfobulbaceae bacterium]|nr:MAG: serine hydrolase [Desulfobulbaceae bacterium]